MRTSLLLSQRQSQRMGRWLSLWRPQGRGGPRYTVCMMNGYGRTYEEQGRIYLAQAFEELERGDLGQASEKGWGAAAQLVKAVAEQRGLPHSSHGFLYRAVGTIYDETGDDALRQGFMIARGLHGNFYQGGDTAAEIEAALRDVERFVTSMESLLNGH